MFRKTIQLASVFAFLGLAALPALAQAPFEPRRYDRPREVVQGKLGTPAVLLLADVTPTDVFPDRIRNGNIWVRITNNGHATLGGQQVVLSVKVNGKSYTRPEWISLHLAPGQTSAHKTPVIIDATQQDHYVVAEVKPAGFHDPKPNNNLYQELIPQTRGR